eukprot:3936384-Rhodomonas_salina.1
MEPQQPGSHEPGPEETSSQSKTRSGTVYGLSACITIKGDNVKAKFHRPHNYVGPRQRPQPLRTATDFSNATDNVAAAAATTKPKKFFKPVHSTEHTKDRPIMEPRNAREALVSPQAAQWLESIRAEVQGLVDKQTFLQSYLPKGAKAIPTRLVFKVKTDEHGNVKKYKCLLVVKGYHQRHGVDYDDSFAPVAHATAIRVALALATAKDWDITHVDVTQAFLNTEMGEKEVYVEPPDGIPSEWVEKGKVWKLLKFLYGQADAPRAWHQTLAKFLTEYGFAQAGFDGCTYILRCDDGAPRLILVAYVDDCILINPKEERRLRD